MHVNQIHLVEYQVQWQSHVKSMNIMFISIYTNIQYKHHRKQPVTPLPTPIR